MAGRGADRGRAAGRMRGGDSYANTNYHAGATHCYRRAHAYGGSNRNPDSHRRADAIAHGRSDPDRAAYANSHACPVAETPRPLRRQRRRHGHSGAYSDTDAVAYGNTCANPHAFAYRNNAAYAHARADGHAHPVRTPIAGGDEVPTGQGG